MDPFTCQAICYARGTATPETSPMHSAAPSAASSRRNSASKDTNTVFHFKTKKSSPMSSSSKGSSKVTSANTSRRSSADHGFLYPRSSLSTVDPVARLFSSHKAEAGYANTSFTGFSMSQKI